MAKTMTGIIFDIQTYAIHDGPGIRTCVFFKGCALRCPWCHNPESQRREPELFYWEEKCARCERCAKNCPNQALCLDGAKIRRDIARCTNCGTCVEICPGEAVKAVGYETSAHEVALEVVRDKLFYDNSGGGATMTGGEPTYQAKFLFEVLDELRSSGIHTALETCGCFHERIVERLTESVDLFLFDIKHLSDQRHKAATGTGNQLILANFSRILDRVGEARIIPRIPVVPGFNSDPESVESIAAFLSQTGLKGPIHLMPYHGWALGKYRGLGRDDSIDEISEYGEISETKRDRISSAYCEKGLDIIWH